MAGRGLAALPSNGTLTNYTPTLRERMADALRRTFYSDDLAGQQQAEKVLNFGEAVTPLGTLTGAYDAGRDAGQGNYGLGALQLGMAMIPGPNLKHGSPTKGLKMLNKSERGPLGPGVYTSPSESIARAYAGDAGELYSMPKSQYDIYTGAGYRDDAGYYAYQNDKRRLIDAAEPEKRAEIEALVNKMGKLDGYPLYARLRGVYGGDEGAQALFKRAGFDGLSGLVDGPETLLFDPQSLAKIRAYHGSPHSFDRFDMSKIGTGEGAQDHGKGLYFTDYEAKAMLYKNPASRWGINNDLERYSKMGPGATYEVDISADPENFLDWQKPWKDQVPEGSPLHDAIMQTNAGKDMLDQRKLYSVWNDDVESVAKKTGVPGIKDKKYGGEVDYSVFDDKLINIVRKYGLAALLPAGALAAGASQDQGGYQ